ncbi:conserved hypothetical protein [Burkholderiales bacterium 8X]|nr:conserved hypothetical protein [Burkholderiales bacterium 8X]
MRLLILQTDSLQSIKATLQANDPQSAVSMERLRRLNPHLDLARLEPGAVLFLPDAPELAQPESRALDGGSFDELRTQIEQGLEQAAGRSKAGFEQLGADRTEVAGALKGAAVKRLIDSDAALRAQVEQATARFAADQRDAKEAASQIESMQKAAAAELAVLSKLLPG